MSRSDHATRVTLAAVLAGTALRLWRLPSQIPVDDEWHALHRVVDSSYADILLSFGFVDHCIPLTLFYKLAADTIGLGDAVFRAPSFLAGVALLVAAPWLVRDRLTPWATAGFAWLLALSPLLVLYSRFARPYALATLLGFFAIDRAARYAAAPSRRDAALYGVASALAIYVLPPTAPFVLAPALWGLLRGGRRSRAVWWRPLAWALGLVAPLVLPPLVAHPEFVFGKLGAGGFPTAAALGRASGFFLGTDSILLAIVAGAGIGFGALRLARLAPRLATCAGASCAALFLGIFAAAPAYAWLGFVLARYALPALPFVLLALAAGIDGLPRLPQPLRVALTLAIALLLFGTSGMTGALAEGGAWLPNRWIAAREGTPPEVRAVPAFYRELAKRPPRSVTLVEAPWIYSLWNNGLPRYESVHRQRTRIGFTEGLCSELAWGQLPDDAGIRLSAFVRLADVDALRAAGVDYIVLHRDPLAELARIIDPIDAKATPIPPIEGCATALLAKGWQRVYADASILALAPPE